MVNQYQCCALITIVLSGPVFSNGNTGSDDGPVDAVQKDFLCFKRTMATMQTDSLCKVRSFVMHLSLSLC